MSAILRTIDFNSLRTRLTVFFLLFGVLPAISLLGVYFSFKTSIEQAYRTPIKDTAVALGDVIDRNLFERYGDVQAFGVNAAAWVPENWRNPSAENPLIGAMNSYMTNYGLYRLMILVDQEGSVLAVNSVDPLGKPVDTAAVYQKNFSDASWFRKAIAGDFLNGKNGLTGTVVEPPAAHGIVASTYGDDGYTIAFAAPVKNAAGEKVGVWVNFADFGLVEEIVMTFYKSLSSRGLAAAEIIVTDAQNRVLVFADPLHSGGAYKRDLEFVGKKTLADTGMNDAGELEQIPINWNHSPRV